MGPLRCVLSTRLPAFPRCSPGSFPEAGLYHRTSEGTWRLLTSGRPAFLGLLGFGSSPATYLPALLLNWPDSGLGFSLRLYQRPVVSKKKEERTKQHQARVIQFFSAVVIGNVSASLDFEQRIGLLYLSFNQPYTFILVQSNNSGCFVTCPTVFCVLSLFF